MVVMPLRKKNQFNPIHEFNQAGDSLEGVYLGTHFIQKTGSNIHTIKMDDGTIVDIWGTGQLDYWLAQETKGSKIKIVYQGKQKVEGFKNEMHQFDIYGE